MNNKQLLGLGLVSAAGIGAFFLLRNKQSKATTQISAPQRQSTSLVNEDSERKKLYDELYISLVNFLNSLYAKNIEESKNIKIELEKALSEGKINIYEYNIQKNNLKYINADGYWSDSLGNYIALPEHKNSLVGIKLKEHDGDSVYQANIILDFEMPTLEKMSIEEIKLYIEYIKLVTDSVKKSDYEISNSIDPFKQRDFIKLIEKYDWDKGNKQGLFFRFD
jgi:hypothetical protein